MYLPMTERKVERGERKQNTEPFRGAVLPLPIPVDAALLSQSDAVNLVFVVIYFAEERRLHDIVDRLKVPSFVVDEGEVNRGRLDGVIWEYLLRTVASRRGKNL